jgi:hypothetical protein
MIGWTIFLIACLIGFPTIAVMLVQLHRLETQDDEIRRLVVCDWPDCDLPADAGMWTVGEHYCGRHMNYVRYGLEEPL